MPSADFYHTVKFDCSNLSHAISRKRLAMAVWQTSRGKTRNCRCVNAGFIKYTPIVDGGLRGHVPTRPGCTTPNIRFLFVAPHLWIGLPPGPSRDGTLALLLTLGSTNTWYGDSHPVSYVPCPAHTLKNKPITSLNQPKEGVSLSTMIPRYFLRCLQISGKKPIYHALKG